jgi:hypothetical protein
MILLDTHAWGPLAAPRTQPGIAEGVAGLVRDHQEDTSKPALEASQAAPGSALRLAYPWRSCSGAGHGT